MKNYNWSKRWLHNWLFARLQLFHKIFKNDCNSSKEKALNADPKAIQQINFSGNQSGNNNRLMFFIIEKAKEKFLDFSQGTVKLLWVFFFNI